MFKHTVSFITEIYVGVVSLMDLLKHDVLKDAVFEIKREGPNVSRSTCICPLELPFSKHLLSTTMPRTMLNTKINREIGIHEWKELKIIYAACSTHCLAQNKPFLRASYCNDDSANEDPPT